MHAGRRAARTALTVWEAGGHGSSLTLRSKEATLVPPVPRSTDRLAGGKRRGGGGGIRGQGNARMQADMHLWLGKTLRVTTETNRGGKEVEGALISGLTTFNTA
jgi:hypothetical protein